MFSYEVVSPFHETRRCIVALARNDVSREHSLGLRQRLQSISMPFDRSFVGTLPSNAFELCSVQDARQQNNKGQPATLHTPSFGRRQPPLAPSGRQQHPQPVNCVSELLNAHGERAADHTARTFFWAAAASSCAFWAAAASAACHQTRYTGASAIRNWHHHHYYHQQQRAFFCAAAASAACSHTCHFFSAIIMIDAAEIVISSCDCSYCY